MTQFLVHPLDGAGLRVLRAEEHLTDLGARIDAFTDNEVQVTALRVEGRTVSVVGEQNQPPAMLGVVVGEVVQNLRAALDYLVFELAILDTGEPQRGTQFLIEDQEETFRQRISGRLKGLSKAHTELIESCQPFKGCGWSRLIRDISNQDKHRALHLVTSTGNAQWPGPHPRVDTHLG